MKNTIIAILLGIAYIIFFFMCINAKHTPTHSNNEIEDYISEHGHDSVKEFVRDNYEPLDIWDEYEIEDYIVNSGYFVPEGYVRENYSISDIWDEDEIKEEVENLGLLEEWYKEYRYENYGY